MHSTFRIHHFLLLACIVLGAFAACKTVKLKDAEKAHDLQEYAKAAEMYNTLYRRAGRTQLEMKAYTAFRSGENYRASGRQAKALRGYINARRYGYPDSVVLLRLAQTYQQGGNYKEAETLYREYLEAYPNSYFGAVGLEGCRFAVAQKEYPTRYEVRRATAWNSARGDFGPAYTPDGSALYFTSSRSKDDSLEESRITGLKPNDIYIIKRDAQGRWGRPDSVPGGINTPWDEGVPSISPDGSTIYYTVAQQGADYDRTAQIYSATRSGEGGWGTGSLVDIMRDSLRLAGHPALSASGDYLYFVSNIGGGYGGKDIYRAKISDRSYGSPENLGSAINTPGNEMYPYMEGDSTLFFASDGHPGLGGLDIFKATLDSTGQWTVVNMGQPINSPSDDYGFVIEPKGKDEVGSVTDESGMRGVFCSTRGDARGWPHLFLFELPAIFTEIQGYVLDREENPIAGATVRIVGERGPVGQGQVTTRDDGFYKMSVQGDTRYVMLAGARGYLNQYVELKTDTARQSETYYVDFFLASREKAEGLQNIFYDFDKATLRPESKASLNELVRILNDNPDIRIELGSHADRKGPDAYNIDLSDRRAQAVVVYLTSEGIAAERLTWKGYGKSTPKVITAKIAERYDFLHEGDVLTEDFVAQLTPEQQAVCDQLNRRTEFRVLDESEEPTPSADSPPIR